MAAAAAGLRLLANPLLFHANRRPLRSLSTDGSQKQKNGSFEQVCAGAPRYFVVR
jgi:hypothetical protein